MSSNYYNFESSIFFLRDLLIEISFDDPEPKLDLNPISTIKFWFDSSEKIKGIMNVDLINAKFSFGIENAPSFYEETMDYKNDGGCIKGISHLIDDATIVSIAKEYICSNENIPLAFNIAKTIGQLAIVLEEVNASHGGWTTMQIKYWDILVDGRFRLYPEMVDGGGKNVYISENDVEVDKTKFDLSNIEDAFNFRQKFEIFKRGED